MAKSTSLMKTELVQVEKTTKVGITLELSLEEAQALRCLLGKITGDSFSGIRGYYDRIFDALAYGPGGIDRHPEYATWSKSINEGKNIEVSSIPGFKLAPALEFRW
jgi:hypothetical protein